ncbi:Na+/Ca+ antiporter, CaCA family [Thalassoporum mexicanum PCC 7367]|uniref:calcium/sodium antiporter n=1 Tax=Thalassoporum mexicanum TaxID=3457544 RepID=UPI00029FE410|nr:calcium/sodium antiporter [Pseudanabaena sp. PCC 7367]AFY70088.1 Na+/Ca+ antiporter, CaCA family [Pseudanabaena sp. PCC 7367]
MNLITIILFIAGFVLLVVGAEFLVKGAGSIARVLGISSLVVALTVVAYGTSAPEVAVSVSSTFNGYSNLAIGNVVGSNIANVLLVLGISATVAPLAVSKQLVRLDVPLMIALSLLLLFMGLDGKINRLDGAVLCLGAVAYTAFTLYYSFRQRQPHASEASEASEVEEAEKSENIGSETSEHGVQDLQGEPANSRLVQPSKLAGEPVIYPGAVRAAMRRYRFKLLSRLGKYLGFVVVGLLCLVLGSRWLVNGAIAFAQQIGVDELVIGLTIVAVGTSLPEIATALAASLRGEKDIAVGNVVGSNIFNILLVLGICSIITPNGITVSQPALTFDIPVMIAVAIAALPIFFSGYKIERWEGILFLAYYIAYTLYLFLNASDHQSLAAFNTIMLVFVLPLTTITLAIILITSLRQKQQH